MTIRTDNRRRAHRDRWDRLEAIRGCCNPTNLTLYLGTTRDPGNVRPYTHSASLPCHICRGLDHQWGDVGDSRSLGEHWGEYSSDVVSCDAWEQATPTHPTWPRKRSCARYGVRTAFVATRLFVPGCSVSQDASSLGLAPDLHGVQRLLRPVCHDASQATRGHTAWRIHQIFEIPEPVTVGTGP